MQIPQIPDNEQQRLQALYELHLLDTKTEERFDRLTRLAKHIFGVPIALISLVDKERQWFKSSQGLDACETGRDVSFCGHAILGEGVFEVKDATKDIRFADNPLVTGPPHIRFYIGSPLTSIDGYQIGTLCLIDMQPRQFSADEYAALDDLAAAVEAEINQVELQAKSRELKAGKQLAETIARAQSQFINEDDRRQAFGEVLADVLELTGSEFGLIGEVLRNHAGSAYFEHYIIANQAGSDERPAFDVSDIAEENLRTRSGSLFAETLSNGKPMFSSAPFHDQQLEGLPEGLPIPKTFLSIPIFHGDKMVALLGLGNRVGGYDAALIDFLSPLLATLGQLVVAAQLQQQYDADQLELARLSRVASQTTNGVIITDPEGRVEWINEGFTRISGYTLDELRGRKPGELLQGSATDPEAVEKIRIALAQGKGFDADLINYARDGRLYWIRIQCDPIFDEESVLQGFMAIQSDITLQKHAEAELYKTTQFLEGILENVPSMIFLKDAQNLRYKYFNRACELMVGLGREDIIGRNDYDLFPKVQADSFTNMDLTVMAQEELVDIPEEQIDTPSGRRILHTRKLALRDEKGKPQYLLGISEDITKAKQSAAALEASEVRFRGLFEFSPVGIVLNDFDTGVFLDVNEALLSAVGYTREEFLDLTSAVLTTSDNQEQEEESIAQNGQYGPFEKEYIRKDGSRYPVLTYGMVVKDSSGRRLVWSIIEDISERKRIERLKSEFIATVSHELRTPLTSINGALSLIVSGVVGELPDNMRDMLKIAQNNTQRLGILINDLLDMEKLVAGKMHFDLQVQALQPILEQAIQDNQVYANRFKVRLVLQNSAGDTLVNVDAQRLQQVLANLLSNAAKFSPEGEEVSVSVSWQAASVRVSVTDRGAGIPEIFQPRIFEKFAQADASNTRQQGGSGLGLAITRQLVEYMGGNVGFDSMPGLGVTFWFEFTTNLIDTH